MWIVLGQAAAMLGTLIGVRLLTELLDPASYGELALGMTLATLVNQVALGPLGNGVSRFYAPAQERSDLPPYFAAVRHLLFLAAALIAAALVVTLAALAVAGEARWMGLAGAALAFATISGLNAILNGVQSAARQRAVVALHQGAEPLARLLLAAGLILALGANSTAAMLGYVLGVALVLGSQYAFFRRLLPHARAVPTQSDWQRQIWNYTWPISVFGAFTWLQVASDRWALELYATTREVGTFIALYQLGYYPMSIASTMAMQFLAPIFYQRAGDASDHGRTAKVSGLSWRLTVAALAATAAAFVFGAAFHREIFQLLVAREYAAVSHLLPWMLLAGGLFAAGQVIALDLMSQLRTRAMMAAKISTALAGVAMNFGGAYWLGTTGIVAAAVAFSALYLAWMAVLTAQSPLRSGPA